MTKARNKGFFMKKIIALFALNLIVLPVFGMEQSEEEPVSKRLKISEETKVNLQAVNQEWEKRFEEQQKSPNKKVTFYCKLCGKELKASTLTIARSSFLGHLNDTDKLKKENIEAEAEANGFRKNQPGVYAFAKYASPIKEKEEAVIVPLPTSSLNLQKTIAEWETVFQNKPSSQKITFYCSLCNRKFNVKTLANAYSTVFNHLGTIHHLEENIKADAASNGFKNTPAVYAFARYASLTPIAKSTGKEEETREPMKEQEVEIPEETVEELLGIPLEMLPEENETPVVDLEGYLPEE